MREIIDWLRGVEQLAHDLYLEASTFFGKDQENAEFSTFLHRLGQDEAQHFNVMDSASDYLRASGGQIPSDMALTQAMTDRVETPLRQGCDALRRRTLSREHMIDAIVQAEFSEWNSIFLYVVNTLKASDKVFEHAAAAMQAHQGRIEKFLETDPYGSQRVREIRELPTVWQTKLLVVEDYESLRILLSELLSSRGAVETAWNGEEALAKTGEHFFNVIISDIDMPVMDGLDFYKEAVKADPHVQARFIFCSGAIKSEGEALIQRDNLPYLKKPFDPDALFQIVDRIVQSQDL